ncbi:MULTISPECIES: hypothetical protein [unclassified Caballeronia]|uniref:hypothetical protein n=1 Tax=unclassified Caballeronia TaxID=2646786 RepID=UPI00285B5DE2|nr:MULTISPECIES: hypothetical protein [unclassified Caballeronia]MDR5752357.1 hypothetical protein [Caballeronia sp. LZ024]MDR5845162.1 hypothetical protein [Caballeronia sp. LZ031]
MNALKGGCERTVSARPFVAYVAADVGDQKALRHVANAAVARRPPCALLKDQVLPAARAAPKNVEGTRTSQSISSVLALRRHSECYCMRYTNDPRSSHEFRAV